MAGVINFGQGDVWLHREGGRPVCVSKGRSEMADAVARACLAHQSNARFFEGQSPRIMIEVAEAPKVAQPPAPKAEAPKTAEPPPPNTEDAQEGDAPASEPVPDPEVDGAADGAADSASSEVAKDAPASNSKPRGRKGRSRS